MSQGFKEFLKLEVVKGGLSTASDEELEREIDKRALNPHLFPLDIFNERVKPFVNQLVDKYSLPTAYVGGALISSYSASIGTAYKASFNGGDFTYLTTWCGLTGISSSGKSTAINKIYQPLREIQNEFSQQYSSALSVTSKKDPNEGSQRNQYEIDPNINDLMFRDTVVATLVRDTLQKNPKGLIKNVDELAEWIKGLNPLSRGEGTDEEFWLSTWSCYPYMKTLSGNKRYHVQRPFINIIGGIQWDVLPILFAKNRGSSGFAFRILFSLAEHDNIALMDPFFKMPEEFQQPHFDCINRLYKDLPVTDHFEEPKICITTRPAAELYLKWRDKKAMEINSQRDRDDKQKYSGIFGKINEYVLRFAALLHLSDRALEENIHHERFRREESINEVVMARALKLADYYYNTALYAFESVEVKNNPNIKALQVSALLRAGNSKMSIGKFLYGTETEANRKKAEREINKLAKDYPKYFGGKS